jgi:predicted nucleotidyltransferase
MYLENILGSFTKINALNVLVNNPTSRFVEKDLAIASGASASEINRQMHALVGSGMVFLEIIGRTKVYSLNGGHFLVKSLQALFGDLNRVFNDAAKEIARFAVSFSGNLDCVILVGSVAVKKVREDLVDNPSDIDLVFVLKDGRDKASFLDSLLAFIEKDIVSKYGFTCYPVVISRKEYLAGLNEKNSFMLAVQNLGVELHGRKPKRFG